jgi:hypothetical protein
MLRALLLLLTAVLVYPMAGFGQAGTASQSREPFKVGTFLIGNTPTVGIVLRDTLFVDLARPTRPSENRGPTRRGQCPPTWSGSSQTTRMA